MPPPPLHPRWRTIFMVTAIVALIWSLAARILGPSDLWDQTQPRTVSYTTDIIVNGGSHWILPVERGELPATKPPLYNWLAVPAVRALGFSSRLAHKSPSVVALVACFVVLVVLGNRLDVDGIGVGWVAATCFVTSHSIVKLGYLARPDMLLTLWLLLAWIAATHVLARGRTAGLLPVAGFWVCIALAGLTKGPPALLPMIYAVVAAPVIGGSWTSINRLRWWWGLPLVLVVVGAWIYGVWRIDPGHLEHELWYNEVYGRVVGKGTEVHDKGFVDWLRELPFMAAYFVSRFAPWSIATILMYFWLLQRIPEKIGRRWRTLPEEARPWIVGAAVYVPLVIVFFSLSLGKRADYIASTFAPGALLASWWLLRAAPFTARRLPWLVPSVAGVTLAALTWANQRQLGASPPIPGFSGVIARFIDAASAEMQRRPAEVAYFRSGDSQLKAMLGASEPDSLEKVEALIERGEPFWLVAGRRKYRDDDFAEWYYARNKTTTFTAVVRSDDVPDDLDLALAMHAAGWPEKMTLYWAVPPAATPANADQPP